jgi:putative transposase
MKYRPQFLTDLADLRTRGLLHRFFPWHNHDHRHSAIGYHPPADVHFGRASVLREHRAQVLATAYALHPERFVRKPPEPPRLPTAAWINKPQEVTTAH